MVAVQGADAARVVANGTGDHLEVDFHVLPRARSRPALGLGEQVGSGDRSQRVVADDPHTLHLFDGRERCGATTSGNDSEYFAESWGRNQQLKPLVREERAEVKVMFGLFRPRD